MGGNIVGSRRARILNSTHKKLYEGPAMSVNPRVILFLGNHEGPGSDQTIFLAYPPLFQEIGHFIHVGQFHGNQVGQFG